MKKNIFTMIILLAYLAIFCQTTPPAAQQIPFTQELHGYTLSDEFHWLKDKSRTSPQVLLYLEEENAYTDEMMKHTQSLQDSLYSEFLSRIPDNDSSIPYKMGSYWYYSRDVTGMQYALNCRRLGSMEAPEEIYLDQNELAEGKEYFYVNNLSISTNENLLAYLADYDGSEIYTLYVKDLSTGSLLADSLYNVDDICWANDNQTLFYCTLDEAGRTDRVWRHKLGENFAEDEMIYHEEDEAFYAYVYKSKSRKYIVIGSSSKTTSEMRLIPADNPEKKPVLVEKRRDGIEYYLTHHENKFFVTTNENAPDFKLMIAPETSPQREFWQEFIPWRKNLSFDSLVYKDYLILKETKDYQDRIRIINLITHEDYYLDPPNKTARLILNWLPEYNSTSFRYMVESMQSPWQKFEFDLITREQKLIKEQFISDYQPGIYQSERYYATAADGEKIPISLVYNKDQFARDGAHPLFLTGYGAYGDNSDPYFSTTKLSLLDRGYCWAIAHVRGGGEMGKRWYDAGKMEYKTNTFTDFIACSEFLIDNDFTSSQLLAIEGASAGGLLIGAVINMRPDLFKVAVGDVPFVDLINTMLDPTLSATVSEYDEWGNPQIKEEFERMYSYCPYSNVAAQNYPDILLLGGFYDPRVNYWEPAKLCARLRSKKTDDNLLLLKITDAGHGGSSGRYDYLKEVAFEYAFVIDRINHH